MKYLKLFEDLEDKNFVEVPSDFNKLLKQGGSMVDLQKDYYNNKKNQIEIDLFYNLKTDIREYVNNENRTQDNYEEFLNNGIDGVLYKFSKGKYTNILTENVELVKKILWSYINKNLPYDKVNYVHPYDLRSKLLSTLKDFSEYITHNFLFNIIY